MTTKRFFGFLLFLISFFFFGCASKQGDEIVVVVDSQERAIRYKPIIGSRNQDSRMGVDLGVVLKGWIAPYKTKTQILVAGHDVYFWVEKPDFIAGTAVPKANRGVGAITPLNKLPFSIAPKDIDRSDIDNDEVIMDFLNNAQNSTNGKVDKKLVEEEKQVQKKKKELRDIKTTSRKNRRNK